MIEKIDFRSGSLLDSVCFMNCPRFSRPFELKFSNLHLWPSLDEAYLSLLDSVALSYVSSCCSNFVLNLAHSFLQMLYSSSSRFSLRLALMTDMFSK